MSPLKQALCAAALLVLSINLPSSLLGAEGEPGPPHEGTFASKPFSELGRGKPLLMQGPLSPAAFRASTAKELAKPELLWLNFAWLREKGFAVPAEGVTPAFLKEIYHTLAYQIPDKNDPASAFLDHSIQVYADGYASDGGINMGSGRAASWGVVQAKGIGRTAQVRETTPDHSNGAAVVEEGLKEASSSEIVHNDLVLGGNRVVALIATGTVIPGDHGPIPRILIIREDMVRPAHFIRNYHAPTPEDVEWDKERVRNVIKNLPDALPHPPGAVYRNAGEKLKAGMENFVKRLALQYADAWTVRLHHGASTISNVLIDASMVDYGTFTGLGGWTRYLTMNWIDTATPFGNTGEIETAVLDQFIKDLRKAVPPSLLKYLPSPDSFRKQFKDAYAKALPQRLLRLTGAPDQLLEEIKTGPAAKALGKTLRELTEAGNTQVLTGDEHLVANRGTYRVRDILQKLAQGKALESADIGNAPLRRRLSGQYGQMLVQLQKAAARQRITPQALSTYMGEASEVITRDIPGTYDTAERRVELNDLWSKYLSSGRDRKTIQEFIDRRIDENSRIFKDAAPFEVVISQKSLPEQGVVMRKVFDARAGKYFQLYRVASSGGRSNFFGNILPTKELESAKISYVADHGNREFQVLTRAGTPYTEFRVESSGTERKAGTLLLNTGAGKLISIKNSTTLMENPCSATMRRISALAK